MTQPRKTGAVTVRVTWNEIFSSVAPLMIDEAAEASLKAALDSIAHDKAVSALADRDDFHDKKLSGFTVQGDDFQTMKVQLRALGLMAKSSKTRSVRDKGTYWTLTPYGDEVMTQLRAIRRDGGNGESDASEAQQR